MTSEASSSSSKVRKNCNGDGAVNDASCTDYGEDDRISNLPDAILSHILSSFSSTKEAVRTSVLSIRWRYVWTSVPHIEINDHLLLLLSKDYTTKCKTPRVKGFFIEFVYRVLRLNDVSCLRKFDLICYHHYGGSFCEWIRALSSRDVQELCLQYDVPETGQERRLRIQLPPCIFTCKKLVILKLTNQFVLNVPISVCLPSLEILHLALVHFFDDDSMENLIAGCPVLKELDMERDYYDNTETLHIHSSSLKCLKLVVDESSYRGLGIVLDAINLEQLHLIDYATERFDVNSLSSVVSVSLDLYKNDIGVEGEEEVYLELLRKMVNTKYLKLYGITMLCLEFATLDNMPLFHYLTHLEVNIVDSSMHVLPYLLECSPNLITVHLSLEFADHHLDEVGFRTPKCLMLHLESIIIKGFNWSQKEMEMVRYFLMNSTVLKKMYIDAHGESNLCKELFMLPKASTACELEIFSYDLSLKKMLPLSKKYRD